MASCRRRAGQPNVRRGAIGRRAGRMTMAKGQKRSNREVKKPKADKKKAPATAGGGVAAAVKAKTEATTAAGKK